MLWSKIRPIIFSGSRILRNRVPLIGCRPFQFFMIRTRSHPHYNFALFYSQVNLERRTPGRGLWNGCLFSCSVRWLAFEWLFIASIIRKSNDKSHFNVLINQTLLQANFRGKNKYVIHQLGGPYREKLYSRSCMYRLNVHSRLRATFFSIRPPSR